MQFLLCRGIGLVILGADCYSTNIITSNNTPNVSMKIINDVEQLIM